MRLTTMALMFAHQAPQAPHSPRTSGLHSHSYGHLEDSHGQKNDRGSVKSTHATKASKVSSDDEKRLHQQRQHSQSDGAIKLNQSSGRMRAKTEGDKRNLMKDTSQDRMNDQIEERMTGNSFLKMNV